MTSKLKWQIGNVIFGLCGGWLFAACWFLIGTFFYVTFLGRPVAKYCFLIARFAARPYGRVVAPVGMQLEQQLEEWQWQR